jgi:hypothetical protein
MNHLTGMILSRGKERGAWRCFGWHLVTGIGGEDIPYMNLLADGAS